MRQKIIDSTRKMLYSLLTIYSVISVHAEQENTKSLPVEIPIQEKIAQIIKNEKKLHEISLSDNEAKKALAFFLEKKEITLSTFSKISEQGKIISRGLRLVVDKRENSTEVYVKLKMQSNGIGLEMWNYYLKNYSTSEKIKKFDAIIPDSMEKVTASGAIHFSKQLSDWLLFRKIIIDFDTIFPENIDIPPNEKERRWWSIAIKKYQLPHEQEQTILSTITVSGALAEDASKLMTEFFQLEVVKLQ